jgi:hypothetical protein
MAWDYTEHNLHTNREDTALHQATVLLAHTTEEHRTKLYDLLGRIDETTFDRLARLAPKALLESMFQPKCKAPDSWVFGRSLLDV